MTQRLKIILFLSCIFFVENHLLGNIIVSEDAFYPISSLYYFSDYKKNVDDRVVETLFQKALKFCDDPNLNKAYQLYRLCDLHAAKYHLCLLWEKLSSKILGEISTPQSKGVDPNLKYNSHITNKMKKEFKPYLLSKGHRLRPVLDSIFSSTNALQDVEHFHQSGFNTLYFQKTSMIRVASHNQLPGYLLKVYLDEGSRTRGGKQGWQWLVSRCKGAKNIRKLIKKKKIKYFTVPDKWLYPLPPRQANVSLPQPVVLIVKDMQIVLPDETATAWKSLITKDHLNELFIILCHGYGTTSFIYNVPYTNEHKFAFIDTEYPKRIHDLSKVKRFLSDEMSAYWDYLIHNGGG